MPCGLGIVPTSAMKMLVSFSVSSSRISGWSPFRVTSDSGSLGLGKSSGYLAVPELHKTAMC